MFGFENQQVKVIKFNPRGENHGDTKVLAGDLKLETVCHNSMLDHFDKDLRKLLYRKPAKGEQSEIAFDKGDDLTYRRLPTIEPIKLDEDFPGYKLHIVSGQAVDEVLKIGDVTLSDFMFEALEGGSVCFTFRASFHPDVWTSGKLCGCITQETCEMTLIAPSREEQDAQQDLAA